MKDDDWLPGHAAMSEDEDSTIGAHPVFDILPMLHRMDGLITTDLIKSFMSNKRILRS